MSVAAGWYPDPWAPDTPVVRWWDGTQWTDRTTTAQESATITAAPPSAVPEAPPDEVPSALDDEAVDRLAEWLAAHQKQHDRARFVSSPSDWFDPDEIDADTLRLVGALAGSLSPGERPLDLRCLGSKIRRMLLALTPARLVVAWRPTPGQDHVEVVGAPFPQLRLAVNKFGGITVVPEPTHLSLGVPREEWDWISGFINQPHGRVDPVGQVLTRPARPADVPAPGWYPDPTGRHAERFWDGAAWAAEGLGDPLPAAQRHPPAGPPAFDDATIDHIVTALFADRLRQDAAIGDADAWGSGGWSDFPHKYRWLMSLRWRALQAQFPVGDPPCDVHIGQDADPILVVSAHRLAVVITREDRVVVDADGHERVELVKRKALAPRPPERVGGRLVVPVTGVERKWLEDFLAGPRVLQGRLEELLARPRPAPDAPDPGWYPDPIGRFDERLWTGAEWTEDVKVRKRDAVSQRIDEGFR